MRSRNSGFTLIELMIVVVVVGLLGAVAVPSYQTYILKSHRSQAFVYLQSLANKQETYYNMNSRYGWLAELDADGLGVEERNGTTTISDGALVLDGLYQLTNQRGTDTFWYQLKAVGTQVSDTECKIIRIDQDWLKQRDGTNEESFCS